MHAKGIVVLSKKKVPNKLLTRPLILVESNWLLSGVFSGPSAAFMLGVVIDVATV